MPDQKNLYSTYKTFENNIKILCFESCGASTSHLSNVSYDIYYKIFIIKHYLIVLYYIFIYYHIYYIIIFL